MIEPGHNSISIRRQCELIGLSRASLHYEPAEVSAENLLLMRLLDEQYTRTQLLVFTIHTQLGSFDNNGERVLYEGAVGSGLRKSIGLRLKNGSSAIHHNFDDFWSR
ncbi:MAG TPA: hypothetical protein VJ810_39235 [Blastocatellia bacterium]|nr:hypothetical protein [Blastocatellia bacterium]